MSRLAITAAMTATHTAAQAASAPTAVPVRRGAGLVGLHQRAQHHARFSPITFSIGTNQRAHRSDS